MIQNDRAKQGMLEWRKQYGKPLKQGTFNLSLQDEKSLEMTYLGHL